MENNIVWHDGHVSYADRCRLAGQNGLVVWFTGLSGSGKSTVAAAVEKRLFDKGIHAYILDGDNLRHGINTGLGFSDEDRNENIRRIAEIAKLFCDAALVTLVSAISPFAQMRENARRLIGSERFIEVYVKASLSVCMERDPKRLYQKNLARFTGIGSAYEPPQSPDLILDTERLTAEEAAGLVLRFILERL